MADNKNIDPVVRLTPEMRSELEGSSKDIERAEHAIGVLKKLGMNTKELEDKLEWAKTAREVLLKEFS